MATKIKIKNVDDRFSRIKGVLDKISDKEIEEYAKIDYPLFSFRYLCQESYPDCNDPKFFKDFLARLAKVSELGWAGIRQSAPHSFGMEPIPVRQMVYKSKLPDFVSSDADLHVFRAVGDNRSFVGLQVGKIFYIFFIEAKFNDIYPHGRRK